MNPTLNFVGIDPGYDVTTVATLTVEASTWNILNYRIDEVPVLENLEIPNPVAMSNCLRECNVCAIEKVWAMPNQSTASGCKLCKAMAAITCIAYLVTGNTPALFPARMWKRYLGIEGNGKDGSRQYLLENYPFMKDTIKYKKDHNKADALCIAICNLEMWRSVIGKDERD